MTPGSCSTGIHILLEELELVFEVYVMNMLRGDYSNPIILLSIRKALSLPWFVMMARPLRIINPLLGGWLVAIQKSSLFQLI